MPDDGGARAGRVEPPQPYRTRLEMVFAANAPKAVILRRGPKRHFHLIDWNLKDDSFTHGQWMKGIVRLCHLSPSGDKLLYWAAQYHASRPEHERIGRYREEGEHPTPYEPIGPTRADAEAFAKRHPKRKLPRYLQPDPESAKKGTRRFPPRRLEGVWTAISRPPWFSALALWPAYGHWTGGGYFRSDNEVVLFESEDGLTPVQNVRVPAGFRVSQFQQSDPRCNRDIASINAGYEETRPKLAEVAQALRAAGHDVQQLEPHRSGTLYIAMDGALFALDGWQRVAPAETADRARMLADFTGHSFQMKRAPAEAMRWK